MTQLHKKFTDTQVKELIQRYLRKEIERTYIQEIMGIKKRRFFILVGQYKKDPANFSIQYMRRIKTRINNRRISLNNFQLRVNNSTPRERVNLRIYPLDDGLSEVRFWCNGSLIDIQKVRNRDLKAVHF